MREWLASLLTASLVSVLAELLSPDGKMKRYVSFALSLLLLAILIVPLADLNAPEEKLRELLSDSLPESEENGSAALSAAASAAEKALVSAVCVSLGLSESALSLSLRYEDRGGDLVLLGVTVRVRDSLTGERVRAYIEREVGAKCEVIVS